MSKTELIERWVDCFNRADVDGLMNLYAEDAINDQVVFSKPLLGKQAIREMFELEFSRATMVCITEKIHECADTAILQWSDPLGLRGCGFFQIKNNLIVNQQGYFDQLTFFRIQKLPVPDDYLEF
jgi:limonene-1,2-epoxide hydrolase